MNYQLGILGIIAIGLLIVDRYVRIQPYLDSTTIQEGFTLNTGTGRKITGKRCGVDIFPCSGSTRCGNGMCISQDTTMPVEKEPLPVFP